MRRTSNLSSLNSPRKRQRLSSPTYDEQLDDISQEDLEAFDAFEASFSQSPNRELQNDNQETKNQQVWAITEILTRSTKSFISGPADDPDNPFTAKETNTVFLSASNLIVPENRISSGSRSPKRSPSPEVPPEQDLDSWFQSTPPVPTIDPQTAMFTSAATISAGVPHLNIGFSKASNKGGIAPSSAALAKAQKKMNEIWREVDNNSIASVTSTMSQNEDSENMSRALPTALQSPLHQRPALYSVGNSLNSPVTPTPASSSRPSTTIKLPYPSSSRAIGAKVKAFKSPLLTRQLLKNHEKSGSSPLGSPLNTSNQLVGLPSFSTAGSQHPLASVPITATSLDDKIAQVSNKELSFTTPMRAIQRGTAVRKKPVPFVTPFKQGVKPGQLGRILQEERPKVRPTVTPPAPVKQEERRLTNDKTKETDRAGVFDLTKLPNRKSLEASGLLPQRYSFDELEALGINIGELMHITPSTALYYSFYTHNSSPSSSSVTLTPPIKLGPRRALEHLLDRGCTLATLPWVENHWCLVLWKLAGMVTVDPERESSPTEKKRWCWDEIMRQLLYRYERELNGGSRPPLRLITAHDAPAAYPMILCVSNIIWSGAGSTEDGMPIEPHPELEVTDGWYRLRAQVDAPLARAIRRGIIRIGRKIGVAGARLSSERKDPSEILEAYNSMRLILSGNSSHLAPWHTKLGFRSGPCISTLHSLTSDGGVVACMDLVVIKAYPIAFFEFIEDENGVKNRDGPRNESEEAEANEQWKKRRELEASKLRTELHDKFSRYEGYIDRLERRAGPRFRPSGEDSPPDHIDNLYDRLEDPTNVGQLLASIDQNDAGWLASHIRDRLEKERLSNEDEIERELNKICPPREVRSFRILVVQDTYTARRPANRKAQLTVWDALNLSFYEGATAGTFNLAQRYLVTHLIPTQASAWMDCEPGSEIYLSTRRDSRWKPIKGPS